MHGGGGGGAYCQNLRHIPVNLHPLLSEINQIQVSGLNNHHGFLYFYKHRSHSNSKTLTVN